MAVQLVLSGDTRFGTSVVHRANDLAQPRGVGLKVGVNDRITRATQGIPAFEKWNRQTVGDRQDYLAKLAQEVWGVAPG